MFVGMTLIGSFGWSVLLVFIGYSTGSLWQAPLGQPSPLLTEAILFVVALASISYIVYYVSKRLGGRTP